MSKDFCSQCGHECNGWDHTDKGAAKIVDWDKIAEAIKSIVSGKERRTDKQLARSIWELSNKRVTSQWHGDGESGL